jgi:hypothetical protein
MLESLTPPIARVVGDALAILCTAAAEHNDDGHWLALLLFAKLVLRRTPRSQARSALPAVDARVRLFASGHRAALFAEAASDAAAAAARPRPQRTAFPVESERFAPFGLSAIASTDATVATVDPAVLRRCERLVKRQQLSKAAAALSAAKVADVNDETAADMQAKHPTGPPVVAIPHLERLPPIPSVSAKTMRRVLGRFALGTSAGPLGLSAQHLLDCCNVVGSRLPDALSALVVTMLTRDVPICIRPFLFGARLVALVKKDGGLRPIACGEIFRRLAGKLLCVLHKQHLHDLFLERSQVGVGVPAGADAMVFAARNAARQLSDGYGVVKLDFRNAFNEVHRSAVLDATAKFLPGLAGSR